MIREVKPIAVVHWIDHEGEKARKLYSQSELDNFYRIIRRRNYVIWTCLCDLNAYVPRQAPDRVIEAR